jgi:hypothetical protein
MLRCSSGADVAGTGNSTGNGVVAGIIIHESGEPAENTEVKLLPVEFNPVEDTQSADMHDTTGSDGAYEIRGIPGIHYNIIALHLSERTRAFCEDIMAQGDRKVTVDTVVLHRPGALNIAIDTLKVMAGDIVFIPGTDIYAGIDAGDVQAQAVVLDSIPAGRMRGARLHRPGNAPVLIGNPADIVPGDTIEVDIPVDLQSLQKAQKEISLYKNGEAQW